MAVLGSGKGSVANAECADGFLDLTCCFLTYSITERKPPFYVLRECFQSHVLYTAALRAQCHCFHLPEIGTARKQGDWDLSSAPPHFLTTSAVGFTLEPEFLKRQVMRLLGPHKGPSGGVSTLLQEGGCRCRGPGFQSCLFNFPAVL